MEMGKCMAEGAWYRGTKEAHRAVAGTTPPRMTTCAGSTIRKLKTRKMRLNAQLQKTLPLGERIGPMVSSRNMVSNKRFVRLGDQRKMVADPIYMTPFTHLHLFAIYLFINLMTSGPVDRKSVVEGKSVDLGGRRIIKKKKKQKSNTKINLRLLDKCIRQPLHSTE